jgi:hypothetical protein
VSLHQLRGADNIMKPVKDHVLGPWMRFSPRAPDSCSFRLRWTQGKTRNNTQGPAEFFVLLWFTPLVHPPSGCAIRILLRIRYTLSKQVLVEEDFVVGAS